MNFVLRVTIDRVVDFANNPNDFFLSFFQGPLVKLMMAALKSSGW